MIVKEVILSNDNDTFVAQLFVDDILFNSTNKIFFYHSHGKWVEDKLNRWATLLFDPTSEANEGGKYIYRENTQRI